MTKGIAEALNYFWLIKKGVAPKVSYGLWNISVPKGVLEHENYGLSSEKKKVNTHTEIYT